MTRSGLVKTISIVAIALFALLSFSCGGGSESDSGMGSDEDMICGGIAGLQCSNGNQVCIFPVNRCNVADNFGACMDRPEVCTFNFDPVCGCDGVTYSNSCNATAAGISIDSMGACE